MIVAPGATSVSVDVFFADDTGAALTGKVAADFPACKWSGGANAASTTITLSDLAAITTAHPNDNTAGGVKEREGGWYRLDLPNNMFTSAGRKTLTFAETTNKRIIAPNLDCQYVQSDPRQWLGGTIPAVNVTGVPLVDAKYLLGTVFVTPNTAGIMDVNTKQAGGTAWGSGAITAASIAADAITDAKVAADVTIASVTGAVGSVTGAVGSVTGNVGGNVVGSVGSVVGAVGSVTGNVGGNVTGSVGSVVGAVGSISGVTFPSNFAALGINASGHISRVTLTDTTTTNTDMRGTDNAALATSLASLVATVGVAGAGLTAADDAVITALSSLQTHGDSTWATATGFSTLDAAGVRTAVGLGSANLDTQLAAINTAITSAVPDSVPADGSRPSVQQALYMITQFLIDKSISGTTVTVKKPDGSTTLFTCTLDDGTTPTSTTRAT